MPDLTAVTSAYVDQLAALANRPTVALLRLWDSLPAYDDAAALRFVEAARSLLEGSAQAATDLAAAYATHLTPTPGVASELIAPAAGARAWDPWDRLAKMLAETGSWSDAIASARTVAAQAGSGAVYQSAREAIAELVPYQPNRKWMRRVTGTSCDWCVAKSRIEFAFVVDATFGHPDCDCVPVPVEAIGDHNARIQAERGIDSPGGRYDASVKLRRSQRVAERHRDAARVELSTETDPDRRERLALRAQDWDVRARRAAERLAA